MSRYIKKTPEEKVFSYTYYRIKENKVWQLSKRSCEEQFEAIKDYVDYVLEYAADISTNWLDIKTQILFVLPAEYRILLAKRHYSTKKRIINDLEKYIISYWENKTNKQIFIDEERLHNLNWIRREKGWALKLINEQRKLARQAQKEKNETQNDDNQAKEKE